MIITERVDENARTNIQVTKVLLLAAGLGAVNNEQYTISPVKMRISGSGVGTSLIM